MRFSIKTLFTLFFALLTACASAPVGTTNEVTVQTDNSEYHTIKALETIFVTQYRMTLQKPDGCQKLTDKFTEDAEYYRERLGCGGKTNVRGLPVACDTLPLSGAAARAARAVDYPRTCGDTDEECLTHTAEVDMAGAAFAFARKCCGLTWPEIEQIFHPR